VNAAVGIVPAGMTGAPGKLMPMEALKVQDMLLVFVPEPVTVPTVPVPVPVTVHTWPTAVAQAFVPGVNVAVPPGPGTVPVGVAPATKVTVTAELCSASPAVVPLHVVLAPPPVKVTAVQVMVCEPWVVENVAVGMVPAGMTGAPGKAVPTDAFKVQDMLLVLVPEPVTLPTLPGAVAVTRPTRPTAAAQAGGLCHTT